MNKCYYCFSDISEDGKCQNCGYDNSAYESKAYHLPIGTDVGGRYIIGAVIGEGGFGITYSAFDKRMNARCAIKEYYPRQISGRGNTDKERTRVFSVSGMEHDYAAGLERFRSEAKRLAKFDGIRNIVNVKNYISENGTGYIIMNYVSGISLKELLNRRGGKLPVDETFALMEPLLRAISVIQRDGVIHRDISPDNIMYSEDKRLVLIDFGSAREYDSEKSMSVILKHGYAPPEQYSSVGKQGPWTDIYSVCATIYRMITGTVPDEAMDRIDGTAAVKKPSELGIKLSQTREEAIMKGLELEIEKRWQTADELYKALYLTSTREKKKFPAAKYISAAAAIAAAAVIFVVTGITIREKTAVSDVDISDVSITTVMTSESVTETSVEETTVSKSQAPDKELFTEGTIPNGYYKLYADGELFIDADGGLETNPCAEHSDRITVISFSDSVESIGAEAFKEMSSLSKVYLPQNVTKINNNAFSGCTSLKSVTYRDAAATEKKEKANLIKIGNYAFSGCTALEEFCFDNVKTIGEYAFSGSGLKSFSSDSSLNSVQDYAFSEAALESIYIEDGVRSIADGAFSNCSSLTDITIKGKPQLGTGVFKSCTALTDVNLSDSNIEEISRESFMNCTSLHSFTFPRAYSRIGTNAFEGCTALEEITVERSNDYNWNYNSVSLSEMEFRGLNIKKITSNVSLYGAEYLEFAGFKNIEEIVFTDNPAHTAKLADGISVNNVTVCDGITKLFCENSVISGKLDYAPSVTERNYFHYAQYVYAPPIVLKERLNTYTIDPYFEYAPEFLKPHTIPDGFTYVYINDPYVSGLDIPEGVVFLSAPRLLGADSIKLPSSIEYLDLSGSDITSINIPDTVKWFSFYNCERLRNVTLPDNLEYIPALSFTNCPSLPSVKVPSSVKVLCETSEDIVEYYNDDIKDMLIYYGYITKDGYVREYKNHYNDWSDIAEKEQEQYFYLNGIPIGPVIGPGDVRPFNP